MVKEQEVINSERIRIKTCIANETNPAALKDLNMDLIMLELRIEGFYALGQLND